MPPRRNPTRLRPEPEEEEVFESGNEGQAQDDETSDEEVVDEGDSDEAPEDDESTPPMRLDTLAKTVPEFDGSYPLITQRWLTLVKDTAPTSSSRVDQRVALARMCLTGDAKTRMSRYLIPQWSGFCERLLHLFSPDDAYHELTTEIMSKKCYTSLPSIQVAITMAEDDHNAVLDYKKTKRTDLSGPILAALTVLFPPEVLTSANFDTYGKFSEQIKLLRKALAKARTRDDRGAAWANVRAETQIFAANSARPRARGKGRGRGTAAQTVDPITLTSTPANSNF
ncbi:hypothetical protein GGH13_004070 [Coemansia sp. S155-1]|nr:hypothetical protein GGH13_004070 [Coemansia sp. S155-1]